MSIFNDQITKIREELKGLIKTETPQDDIKKIAEIDKMIDDASAEYENSQKQYNELKDSYIDVVKNTSFASKEGDPYAKDKGADESEPKPFSEYIKEAQKDAEN